MNLVVFIGLVFFVLGMAHAEISIRRRKANKLVASLYADIAQKDKRIKELEEQVAHTSRSAEKQLSAFRRRIKDALNE